jgi:hypothetical protein
MAVTPRSICQWLEKRDFVFVRTASANNIPIYAIYEHVGDPGEVWAPVTGPEDRYYDIALRREWPDRMTNLIYNIASVLDMPQVEVYMGLVGATTA